MSTLRPLAVGEIIDRSASFWRAHWKPLFQLLLGFQLLQYIFVKAFDLVYRQQLRRALGGATFDPMEWIKNPPDLDPRALVQMYAGLAVYGFLMVVLSQVSGVAGSRYVYARMTWGPTSTVWQSVRFAFERFGASLGVTMLSFGAGALMSLAILSLPAALIAAGAFWGLPLLMVAAVPFLIVGPILLLLWFVMRFILTAQVTAAEPTLSAWGIFRRTGALSSGRVGPGFMGWVKGRLTVLVTIVFGILMLIGTVTGLPTLLLQASYGNMLDPARISPPLWLLVPADLIQVVGGALVAPIYIVFQVVFYVDMRVRREGLDLELALASPVTP